MTTHVNKLTKNMNIKTILIVGLLSIFQLNYANMQAQNTSKMSAEEKKEMMEWLERRYKALAPTVILSPISKPTLDEIHSLPWEGWAESNNTITVEQARQSLKSARLKASASDPNACNFSWNVPKGTYPYDSITYWGVNYLPDNQGNCIAFRNKYPALSGIEVQVEVHLKDCNGTPIYIDTKKTNSFFIVDEPERRDFDPWKESRFAYLSVQTINIPLERPFSEVAEGYIDIYLFIPENYESRYVTKEDIGKDMGFTSIPIRLEDIRPESFMISTPYEYKEKIRDYLSTKTLSHYGISEGKVWQATSSTGSFGDLSALGADLKARDGLITFEDWLKAHGYDPEHLEDADTDEESVPKTRWANEKYSSDIKDTVLFVLPCDSVKWTFVSGKRFNLPTTTEEAACLNDSTRIKGDFISMAEQIPQTVNPLYDRAGFENSEELNRVFSEEIETKVDFYQVLEILHNHGFDVPVNPKEMETKDISFRKHIDRALDIPVYKYSSNSIDVFINGITGDIIRTIKHHISD